MTLVELLIAMTLMAVGIAAIVAGFSSGVFAIGRSSQATTAAALVDQNFEWYRQNSYSSVPAPAAASACPTADTIASLPVGVPASQSGIYSLAGTVCWACPDTADWTYNSTKSPPCQPTGSKTAVDALKQVTITATAVKTGTVLVTESSTFDSLAG